MSDTAPVGLSGGAKYRIGGRVSSHDNIGVSETTVKLDGGSSAGGSTSTDARGKYWFANLTAGGYRIIPVKAGYTFSPPNRFVIIRTESYEIADFRASPVRLE